MSLLSYIRDLDHKFSWSFLGFVLAVLFGSITLYDRYLADKNPQLYCDVLTSTAVLDIREDVPALNILFDGINIKQQNQSLRIMTVRIVNDSSRDILKGLYDPADPLGFRVSCGKIIRADLVNTSNDYLSRNLTIATDTNAVVRFNEVILESHQSFVVKMLVLHSAQDTPTIMPIGHVAGMKEILVREPYRQGGVPPFWTRSFAGSFWVQVVRLVSYFLLVIAIILAIVIPSSMISDKVDKGRRKKQVREFKAMTTLRLDDTDEFIFSSYVKGDSDLLLSMQKLVAAQDVLDHAFKVYRKRRRGLPIESAAYHRHFLIDPFYAAHLMPEYIDAGFIRVQGHSATANPHMKETLNHFIQFLKNKGLIKDRGPVVTRSRIDESEDGKQLILTRDNRKAEQNASPLPRDPQTGHEEGER